MPLPSDPRPSALDRLGQLDRAPSPPDGPPPPAPRRTRGALVGGIAAVGLVLLKVLGKLKFLLTGLKFLKLGALFKTGWTMLFSVWAYALLFGWPYAAGLVLLILVHELGHGAAARLLGLKVGTPVFIPFVGAFIALKEQPRTTFHDFVIGAGGPIAGSAGGLACLVLAKHVTGSADLLRAVGYVTLVINLFNLLPLGTLDGGRMTRLLGISHLGVGVTAVGLVLFQVAGATEHLNPLALFVLLGGLYQLARRLLARRRASREAQSALATLEARSRPPAPDDDGVTPGERLIAALTYFGLAGLLVYTLHAIYPSLPRLPGP